MATGTNYPRVRGQKPDRVRVWVCVCAHGHGRGFNIVPAGKITVGIKKPYPCSRTRTLSLTCGPELEVYKEINGVSRVPLIFLFPPIHPHLATATQ
jgi:hypothetical protein